MLFIHPTWDHESQRIGKQKCIPVGYALHVIAGMIGFVGLLLLFGAPALLAWHRLFGSFRPPRCGSRRSAAHRADLVRDDQARLPRQKLVSASPANFPAPR